MSIIQGTAKASGDASFYDFPIDQSLRFDGSSYLSRGQTSGSQTTMTYSVWVKRSDTNNGHLFYDGNASNAESAIYLQGEKPLIEYYHAPNNYYKRGANLLRDLSAWYHLVFVIDTSNSDDAQKMRIYINSVEITNDVYNVPTLSLSMDFNANGSTVYIGRRGTASTYFNGYLAEINFIDGQALNPYYFGEFKSGSVWIPKQFDGTASDTTYNVSGASNAYGTNGFRLTFALSDFNTSGSAITDPHGSSTNVPDGYVADASGSGNHWNVN